MQILVICIKPLLSSLHCEFDLIKYGYSLIKHEYSLQDVWWHSRVKYHQVSKIVPQFKRKSSKMLLSHL